MEISYDLDADHRYKYLIIANFAQEGQALNI